MTRSSVEFAIALLAAVRARLTVITRLRLDARLFDPPPARRPGQRGRPALKGARQPTLEQRVADAKTAWQRMAVTGWYGDNTRELDIASGTALWYHPGLPPVPVRWVLVRDVAGPPRLCYLREAGGKRRFQRWPAGSEEAESVRPWALVPHLPVRMPRSTLIGAGRVASTRTGS